MKVFMDKRLILVIHNWLWVTLPFILNYGCTISNTCFFGDYRTIYFGSLKVNMLMVGETSYVFKSKPFLYYLLEEYPTEKKDERLE